MKCRRLSRSATLLDRGHRLWCAECRAARSADQEIARIVAGMQAEGVRPEGQARTLEALGLRSADQPTPIAVTQRSHRRPKRWRMVLVAGALAVAFLLLGPVLSTRRDRVDVVLAQAIDALSQVRTLHMVMKESYGDVQHTYENWIKLPDKRRDEMKGVAFWVYRGERALLFRPFQSPVEVLIEEPSGIRFSSERLLQATGLQRWLERRGKTVQVVAQETTTPGRDGRPFRLIEMKADDPASEEIEFYRLRIDRGSHRVVASESWYVRRRDRRVTYRMMIGPIEYNVPLRDSLFDTTIPKGAKLFQFSTPEGARAYVEYKLRQLDALTPERRARAVHEWQRSGSATWTLNRLKRRNPAFYAAIQGRLKQYGINR